MFSPILRGASALVSAGRTDPRRGDLIDAHKCGSTPPGTTLKIEKSVDTPGVFMYHCAAGPVTDLHIKSGIHGAMIVYPRDDQLRPAREIVVVEDAVYGTRDAKGFIPGTDPAKTSKNDQLLSMFSGRLEFYIPEPGVYPFVDHDKLAYLPFGLALAFATDGVAGAAH